MPTESRQLLLDELFVYLKGTELEANMRSSRQMPSHDRYLHMRTLANGSGFFLVLSGYVNISCSITCPRVAQRLSDTHTDCIS